MNPYSSGVFKLYSTQPKTDVPENDLRGDLNVMGRLAWLYELEAIQLSEMDNVALLSRNDTKYLLSEAQLFHILPQLTEHYRILEIEGRRLHHYRTLYFDTADLALYRQHHSGRRNRYKVRERTYVDSELTFLEIKVNSDTTIKNRLQIPALCSDRSQRTTFFVCLFARTLSIPHRRLGSQTAEYLSAHHSG